MSDPSSLSDSAASSATPGTADSPSTQTMAILAAHAGLRLSEAHLAELADAYGYIQAMLGRIHRNRDRADEPAHVFAATTFTRTGKAPA